MLQYPQSPTCPNHSPLPFFQTGWGSYPAPQHGTAAGPSAGQLGGAVGLAQERGQGADPAGKAWDSG